MTEQEIERELERLGNTAPRLTPSDIDDAIVGEHYHRIPNSTAIVCALYLKNGFVVIGEAAAASALNFSEEVGKRVARQHAREKIWQLEGYLLRQRLSEDR